MPEFKIKLKKIDEKFVTNAKHLIEFYDSYKQIGEGFLSS